MLNTDELGLFFNTLPQKGLVEKGKKGRGGKQSKKRCTVALFVAANGSKVCDPIVVWRSKKPRCLKKIKKICRPHGVHYFASAKAWMTTEKMQANAKAWMTTEIMQANAKAWMTTEIMQANAKAWMATEIMQANAKAWVTTEIIQEILKMLDEKMIAEGRNILLFLENAPSHPDIFREGLKCHYPEGHQMDSNFMD